jgi:hypothetical protein
MNSSPTSEAIDMLQVNTTSNGRVDASSADAALYPGVVDCADISVRTPPFAYARCSYLTLSQHHTAVSEDGPIEHQISVKLEKEEVRFLRTLKASCAEDVIFLGMEKICVSHLPLKWRDLVNEDGSPLHFPTRCV